MNNKGFAITGVLYTLFALFLTIILTIIVNISFKKGTLEKTVSELEDDYSLEALTNITDGIIEGNKASIDGKYIFKTKDYLQREIICTAYLKKRDIIPEFTERDLPDYYYKTSNKFTLSPSNCNEYYYEIDLNQSGTSTITSDKLTLIEIYKYKESD